MSEQIGKHKGAVETLLHEKKELSRLLQIVNSQLQRHLQALEDQGIDTDRFIQQMQEGMQEGQVNRDQGQRQSGSRQKRQQSSGNQRRQRSKSQGQRSRGSSGRNQSSAQSSSSEDERDAEDFFEDDDEERDFNPMS